MLYSVIQDNKLIRAPLDNGIGALATTEALKLNIPAHVDNLKYSDVIYR